MNWQYLRALARVLALDSVVQLFKDNQLTAKRRTYSLKEYALSCFNRVENNRFTGRFISYLVFLRFINFLCIQDFFLNLKIYSFNWLHHLRIFDRRRLICSVAIFTDEFLCNIILWSVIFVGWLCVYSCCYFHCRPSRSHHDIFVVVQFFQFLWLIDSIYFQLNWNADEDRERLFPSLVLNKNPTEWTKNQTHRLNTH